MLLRPVSAPDPFVLKVIVSFAHLIPLIVTKEHDAEPEAKFTVTEIATVFVQLDGV
jgi:hypothetical protein